MDAIISFIKSVIDWILWFFPALFSGELFELLGRVFRNLALSALSSLFDLFPADSGASVFDPYCGALNWLVPVDYAVGCLGVIVSAIAIKMASGWILRFLW